MIPAVIVGCGNIAAHYAEDLISARILDLVGFYDVDHQRAVEFAERWGGEAFETLNAAIEAAELVLNLTIFEAHYPVSKAALSRSRHVYSEKPLALSLEDAVELAGLAAEKGVRLASAPFTFLGAAQAMAIDWVRSGRLGEVRLVYAEVNHGRIETWHPNPAPFYDVGPMLDVGVYPLALLIDAFGPVSWLQAIASTIKSERKTLDGTIYSPGSADYWLVHLEHANGVRVRLTVNFYVKGDEGMVFHGDEASLRLDSWFVPDAGVWYKPYDGAEERIEVTGGTDRVHWSTGVARFIQGIDADDPGPLNVDRSVHMTAILDAINRSGDIGEAVAVTE